jgi:Excalibur calcium-binding domain
VEPDASRDQRLGPAPSGVRPQDVSRDQRFGPAPGGVRPKLSEGAEAPARTFLFLLFALDAYCDSLATRSSRYQRPRRRYEDLCLVTAVRRVQRDCLVATTDSDWGEPGVKACFLAWTKVDLTRQALELARSRRWLSSEVRRTAEARARERFEAIATEIATEVPAELFRASEISLPESVAGDRAVSRYAIHQRLGALMAAAARVVPTRSARGLVAGVKRLGRRLRVREATDPEGKQLTPLPSERAGARPRTARAAAICAATAFLVALAVVTGLTGLPFENPAGDAGGPYPKGGVGAQGNVGGATAPAAPRAPTLNTAAAPHERETYAYPVAGRAGRTEALVVALAAWTTPAVAHDKDCSDFKSQKRAQRWFHEHHPGRDPSGLDSDGDGKACEHNPCPCSRHLTRRDRSRRARGAVAREDVPSVAAKSAPSGSTPTGTTGPLPVAVAAPPAPAPLPVPAPGTPLTQPVRSVGQAASSAGAQTGLPQATGGITGGLDQTVGSAGGAVRGATGGLLGH